MKTKRLRQYSNKQRILLVGEGDFSFSLSLARAFGSATNLTATSLDTRGNQLILLCIYLLRNHIYMSYDFGNKYL